MTVSAVGFDRAVKFQFSDGNVEFDFLSINGEERDECYAVDPGTPISECNQFADGPNSTWTHALTRPLQMIRTAISSDFGFDSSFTPDGGANYRVAKLWPTATGLMACPISFRGECNHSFWCDFCTFSKDSVLERGHWCFFNRCNRHRVVCGVGCTDSTACNYDVDATRRRFAHTSLQARTLL